MPSLEFDRELENFRAYYNAQQEQFGKARDKLISMVEDLLSDVKGAEIFAVTGRVKDREEAVAKFTRKYRTGLEASKTPYSIKDHITDLMGLRIVCIYEGDIPVVQSIIARELKVLDVTDKTSLLEEEDSSFGYRGALLHNSS